MSIDHPPGKPEPARSFGGVADAYDRGRPDLPARGRDLADLRSAVDGARARRRHRQADRAARGPRPRRARDRARTPQMLAILAQEPPRRPVSQATGRGDPVRRLVVRRGGERPGVPLVRLRQGAARDRPACCGRAVGSPLVWNQRDERIPWVQRLGKIIGTQEQLTDPAEVLEQSRMFGDVEEAGVPVLADRGPALDPATWSAPAPTSRSCSPPEQEAKMAEVLAFYEEYGRGMDGMQLPYTATLLPLPDARPSGTDPVPTAAPPRTARPRLRRLFHRHAAHRLPLKPQPLAGDWPHGAAVDACARVDGSSGDRITREREDARRDELDHGRVRRRSRRPRIGPARLGPTAVGEVTSASRYGETASPRAHHLGGPRSEAGQGREASTGPPQARRSSRAALGRGRAWRSGRASRRRPSPAVWPGRAPAARSRATCACGEQRVRAERAPSHDRTGAAASDAAGRGARGSRSTAAAARRPSGSSRIRQHRRVATARTARRTTRRAATPEPPPGRSAVISARDLVARAGRVPCATVTSRIASGHRQPVAALDHGLHGAGAERGAQPGDRHLDGVLGAGGARRAARRAARAGRRRGRG